MSEDFPVRTPSLADQIYELVLKGISDGTYPPGAMLPSENQLAERYQVSRPTIRTAFARLADRGYVIRRRGVGTLVAESPSIVNPLYQFLDIFERISSRGLIPGFKQLKADFISASEYHAKELEVAEGSDILNVHKIFTANEKPIIYFENFIPRHVFNECLTDEQALSPGITEPFFIFFKERCNHPIKYLTSIVKPEICQNIAVAEMLELSDPLDTLLVIEDVGFDYQDNPIFCSTEYLSGEASSLHVIRNVENG